MLPKSISVIGCGWLGLPLAEALLRAGYHVKGSKTTEAGKQQLLDLGIDGYQLQIDPATKTTIPSALLDVDCVFFNIPPSRRDDVEQYFPKQAEILREAIVRAGVKQVIFVSSTSVYASRNQRVTESDQHPPEKASGRALRTVEDQWLQDPNFTCTVLRPAGLVGYDRVPGRFLAGKKNLKNGAAPVNLIHRDDVVAITLKLLALESENQIFNACSDLHPTRREFYRAAAAKAGLELPDFDPARESESWKIIDNQKVKSTLDFQFAFPDPMSMI